jgi:hypothetical protein
MDIVQVLGVQLSGMLEEAKLNINSALANPHEDDALKKLSRSINDYAHIKIQLDTVANLSKQMSQENTDQITPNED